MDAIIGTAGWSVAAREAALFPAEGTALERYAAVFRGVEINSSFHRSHRASTWERWAATVPGGFRFSVKVPKSITHQQRLVDCEELVRALVEEVRPLGQKLEVLLVQLPPSLAFDADVAEPFFRLLRTSSGAALACEPRHPSWFEGSADALLEHLEIARVAADPARVPQAAVPGGWRGITYLRLHGSPVPYRSSYDKERLDGYAELVRDSVDAGRRTWCIFDNTASSAATGNALSLLAKTARVEECSA